MQWSIKKSQILMSRLCHELVGPVGAVSNGMELVQEERKAGKDQFLDEALDLVSNSAQITKDRTQFYRVAYGASGHDIVNLAEFRNLAIAYSAHGRCPLTWPYPPILPNLEEGEGQILLNMLVLAQGLLPLGGEIEIDHDEAGWHFFIAGKETASYDCVQSILAGELPEDGDVSAQNIHAIYTGYLIHNTQTLCQFNETNEGIEIIFGKNL